MNPRLTILAVALVLAIAAAVSLRRTAVTGDATLPFTSSPVVATLSKTVRTDDGHHPDRLIGLDPSLHQLAIRLEELQLSWEHNRPPVRGGHADWNDWLEFALGQAGQLETPQITALIEWLEMRDRNYITELVEYRQAFYQTWALRAPQTARDHVIALAERHELLDPDRGQRWPDVSLDEARDMYHFVLAGSAIRDPAKAWKTFRDDLDNPALQKLPDAHVTTQEIFKAYASQFPAEAWHLVLTEPDGQFIHRMLEGYSEGAPVRQDWNAHGAEFVKSLESRGMEAGSWTYRHIAERWITEDPAAALDWYAAHATLYGGDPLSDDPFAPGKPLQPGDLPTGEYQERLKLELLSSMYESHKDRTDEVVHALDQLLTEGETELVITVLDSLTGGHLDQWSTPLLTGGHLDQWSTPLLTVVPNIPDPDLRNKAFLGLVQAIHPRDNDEFSHSSNPLPEPNIPYEAVRELAGKLDLPPDIRARAEAAFRKIEEQETLERAKRNEEERADR